MIAWCWGRGPSKTAARRSRHAPSAAFGRPPPGPSGALTGRVIRRQWASHMTNRRICPLKARESARRPVVSTRENAATDDAGVRTGPTGMSRFFTRTAESVNPASRTGESLDLRG